MAGSDPISFDLLDHQEEFIFSDAKFPCLDGGYGNGKSTAGLVKIGYHCQKYPGTKVGIFREELSDLKKSTLPEFKDLYQDFGSYHYNENTFTFDNGSKVLFHQLSELRKLRNHNLSAGLIEQAEETTESAFWYLVGRLRRTDADHRWLGTLTNPEGHDWIWRLWCDGQIPQADSETQDELDDLDVDPPDKDDFHYINASTYANAENLPDDYLQGLSSMPEHMRDKYVKGNRDVLEGAVYPMLQTNQHYIEPFKIPQDWPKWKSLDYGDTNPTACLWITIDYEGRIYVYREHYKARGDEGRDWLISEHAERIRSLERDTSDPIAPYEEHTRSNYIDPACSAKTQQSGGKKHSIIDEFAECAYSIGFSPWDRANGPKEKLAQINRVSELLQPQQEYSHPQRQEAPAPRLYIFKNCENVWEEHRQYRWKKQKKSREGHSNLPEEPRKKDDHTCDALRGWAAEKFMGPKQKQVAPAGSFDYVRNKHIQKKRRRERNSRFRFEL